MARPLRIERPGGRYHVTARGNERKAVFRDDTDRFHSLDLLDAPTERFGVRAHAYVDPTPTIANGRPTEVPSTGMVFPALFLRGFAALA